MSNITEVLLNTLYLILSTAVVTGMGLLTTYFKKKLNTEKEKSQSETIDALIDISEEVIVNIIDATSQTIVNGLKSKNLFTIDAQAQIFENVKQQITASLTDDMKNAIITKFGMEVNDYLTTKIEAVIAEKKQ